MKEKIARYDPVADRYGGCDMCSGTMESCDDGEYIRLEDLENHCKQQIDFWLTVFERHDSGIGEIHATVAANARGHRKAYQALLEKLGLKERSDW